MADSWVGKELWDDKTPNLFVLLKGKHFMNLVTHRVSSIH